VVTFRQTIPILRIFNVEKAKEFYVDFLGFQIDFEHRFDDNSPLYMQVSRDGLTLHSSEHYGDACPGSTVFVGMDGLEEFQKELAARNYTYLNPGIERDEDIGLKTMETIDPFGNRIRFSEDLDTDKE
jgi:catechol 2,3-dioxygenase-like lactoylglutathione lyase family enzyme